MWYIFLVGLVAQSLATKVTYNTASSSSAAAAASASFEKKNDWAWVDPLGSSSNQQDSSLHPLSFSIDDASSSASSSSQYSANIQSGSSGVGNALNSAVQSGRTLEGYDELYSDPDVKNILQVGNDTAARSYIKDKLCSLGLMNCENAEGRRPYYSPHRDIQPQEVIYAQPVTIKPVGPPLAAIQIKRPVGYGPPKPSHFGSSYLQGPPPSHHGPPGHTYSGPSSSFSGPPPSFSRPQFGFNGPYPSYKKPGYSHSSKPIYEDSGNDGEYDFVPQDKHEYLEKKQVIVQQPNVVQPVQQHVHHHYHHEDGANKLSSGGIIGGGIGQISATDLSQGIVGGGYGYGNTGTYGSNYNDFNEYKKAFKIKPSSATNSIDPILSNGNNYANKFVDYDKNKRESFTNSNKAFSINQEQAKVINSGLNSYGNGNNNGLGNFGNNNYGSNSNSFGESSNFENNFSSLSNDDCICVTYDQCGAINQAGRKDDLFLAIDPRNIGKTIDAESDDSSSTDLNVRVTKGVNVTEQAIETKKNSTDVAKANEEEKRNKREAKAEAKKDEKTDEIQGRLLEGFNRPNLNVKPTWGVSFGLPQGGNGGGGGSGGYPINPYGENPLLNPYPGYGGGGANGANGINLGLVSVNPLLALQVGKDDYGEKVVKPFVNLHVTPNQGLVNKLGNFLAHKKNELLLGGGGYGGGGYYPGGYYPGQQYQPSGPYYNQNRPPPPQQHYHQHQHQHQHQYQQQYQQQHNHHHHQQPGPNWSGGFNGFNNNNYGHGGNYAGNYGNYYGGYSRDADDYDNDDDDDNNDYYNNQYAYNRNANSSIFADDADSNEASQGLKFPDNYDNTKKTGQSGKVSFNNRKKRDVNELIKSEERQFGRPPVCGPRHVCCRRNQIHPSYFNNKQKAGQCGIKNSQGITGRIKTPAGVDGDAEFGEYPWQVAILKKDPTDSVFVCGGTLISPRHILTAAHCIKSHVKEELRVRLGEWDVNNDGEFFPYIEQNVDDIVIHPEFYAGTLYNDLAILKLDHDVNFKENPHIVPACLPNRHDDFTGARCWTTGWGKDAFGDFGKYQNILKEVDVPVVSNAICENQMRKTRLGPSFNLHPGFICAGGEKGKDACRGDGGGPMVCERHGSWQLAGVVSWGIGCGEQALPGVYSRVSYYHDWIQQYVERQYY
ncbi:uncharacterized protein LOC122853451 isoform X2 [Aphidius gifuensis]|uniref:uncharacterized protein LOC122853451 isoform X2 n=1 Tax=Aphidius gifuensis TaxID=684658 RepID=UPI001CDC8EC0|nr:uncharacterized protein LOC122853451 isoform X2 [Aphidius gifuensis]